VTLNGTTVPGLNKRKISTQAEMNFGDTMVIGGLIFTRYTAATNKIPFLGELPGIGAAFRRDNYTEAETELVVMITPEIGSALAPDQVPPGGPGLFTDIPTDRELYIQGLIEVPNYGGGRCANGDCPPGAMPPGGAPAADPTMPMPMPGYDPNFIPGAVPPSPAPASEPTLIAPPGVQPPPPAPPAADPSVSRRGASRTAWPSTSSPDQINQARKSKAGGTTDSGVKQVGYQTGTATRKATVDRAGYQQQQQQSNGMQRNTIKTAQ
jgi:pilus assembly protein CpaC